MATLIKVKERPILFSTPMVKAILEGRKTVTRRVIKDPNIVWSIEGYGKPGDHLWVRETFTPAADYTDCGLACENGCVCPIWFYRADMADDNEIKWKPSIFMPRAACRLLLEIQSIQVERLQDITEDDAIREGIGFFEIEGKRSWRNYLDGTRYFLNPVDSFTSLWTSINGAESWNANPWVWRIEFKRTEL